MNPNQPNNFQPYNPQFKSNQYTNYQFNPQNQFNHNTLNLPKAPNFHQGGSLSPTQNHQVNRPKLDRAMYSSTIEGTLPSKSFGFGKLESMGRFVGNTEQPRFQNNKPSFQFSQQSGQQRQFNFGQQKQKTFETFKPANHQNQFDRFPAFNLQDNHSNQQSFSSNNYQHQYSQQEQKTQNVAETLTPEQKRRRQILAIKQQLQLINKKMESTNLNKKFNTEPERNDNKTSTNSTTSSTNNNYLNPGNFSANSNFSNSSPTSKDNNSLGSGMNFGKNNNLNVGMERNKGLVTQSMIVSHDPSPGYKYQSIFDKYDSMKKPTYETINNDPPKEEKPSLLDKFVNKGPGSQQTNKEPQTFNYSNNLNTGNSYSNGNNFNFGNNLNTGNTYNTSNSFSSTNNAQTYDFSSSKQSNDPVSNFSSNYTASNNSNLTSGSNFTNATYEAPKEGGMFKKKKGPTFTEQVKAQFLPTSPKTNITTEGDKGGFTKFKQTYEDNIVTNAMKQMKIQESVQFKRQDFIVGKKLGKGQFGQVMLVQHKKTGFLCGMKVMEKKQIRDEKYEGQITRQLSIQFYLAHRNITPLYGYFQDEKNVYLLIEYCTGGQLLEMLRKNRRMQEPEVSRIIKQIIEGIDYIHKELIIHRDIKPENILFNFGVAKICDFGWAVYKGHGMRKTASVGSPLYYSPEIVMGVQYDEKIDIWDIGMMTYECLLGKIPFRIYSELDLNRIVQDQIKFPEYIQTSDQAKDFILKIMKKKPQERMQIRQMLRHPFITKYQDIKLPVQIMKDFKEVLTG